MHKNIHLLQRKLWDACLVLLIGALIGFYVQDLAVRYVEWAFAATCGDGIVEDAEECDDGNVENGDGCSSSCAVESGWSCSSGCTNDQISGLSTKNAVQALDSSRIIVLYSDGGALNAKVGTVSNGRTTYGTPVTVDAMAEAASVDLIDTDKVIVTYIKSGNAEAYAEILTIAGTTVTASYAETALYADGLGMTNVRVSSLSTSTFVAGFGDSMSGQQYVIVGSIDGSNAITFGSAQATGGGATDKIDVQALSATQFVVAYVASGASYVKIGNVSGTTITSFGIAQQYHALDGQMALAKLSSTTFVVVFASSTDVAMYGKVGTVSGSDISLGSAQTLLSGVTSDKHAATLDSTHVVVAFFNDGGGLTNYGETIVLVISGNTITASNNTRFDTHTASVDDITALNSTSFVTVFDDQTSQGLSMVGDTSLYCASDCTQPHTAQIHYRWRYDTTALNTAGGWRAAEDVNIGLPWDSTIYRLRIAVANNGIGAEDAARTYKLQFGTTTTACADIVSWTDVDGSSHFFMENSSHITNGEATSALLGNSESYSFTAGQGLDTSHISGSIGPMNEGTYTELEYSIMTYSLLEDPSTAYCFRLYDTTAGAALDSYDAYPAFDARTADTTQLHYRWRDDTTALNTAGGWLAEEDAAVADVVNLETYRLRIAVANTSDAAEAAARRYKLQYGEKSTTCDEISSLSWVDLDGGESAVFWMKATDRFVHGDATTALLTNAEGYSFVAGQGLESSNTSNDLGPLGAAAYTELEYSIEPWGVVPGQDFCFRLYDTAADEVLDTYAQYPQITVASPNTTQLHYRWRDDTTALNTAGGWLAEEDAEYIEAVPYEKYRVRFEVANTGGTAQTSAKQYRIQMGNRSTTCSAVESWTNVPTGWTGSETILVSGSDHITDGQELTPGLLSNSEAYTFVSGQGKDASNTTGNIDALSPDYYTEIEYSLLVTEMALAGDAFCFRLYDATAGQVLDTYAQYPQITVASSNTTQLRYRWRDDSTALNTAGDWLAEEDAAVSSVEPDAAYRLRIGVANTGANAEANPRRYALYYGQKSTTCSAIGSWTAVDAGVVVWKDSSSIAVDQEVTPGLLTNSEGYSFQSGRAQDAAGTLSTIQLNGTSYTELEFSITVTSAVPEGATYCFKLYDSANSEWLDNYDAYPQMSVRSSNVTQVHYRWRDDSTALNTNGGWLGSAEDSVLGNAAKETTYRIRFEVANTSSVAEANGRTYQLQYAIKETTCGAIASWAEITDLEEEISLTNSSHITNSEALTPGYLANTEGYVFLNGRGHDTSSTTTTIGPLNGDTYTEIEYSLRATYLASPGTTYCFRLYDTTGGGVLDTYAVYPELTVESAFTTLRHYRWRDDTYGLNVDAGWLVDEDTQLQSAEATEIYRLRMAVSNTGANAEAASRTYQLQWGLLSTTCEAIASWQAIQTSGGDAMILTNSSNIVNGEAVTEGYLTSHSFSFVNGVAHDTTNTTSALGPLGGEAYTELEYAIQPSNAHGGSVYCFRLYDTTAGTVLNEYKQYPKIHIYQPTPLTDQLHYRWRDDTGALNEDAGWIAEQNTVVTDMVQGETYRLRLAAGNIGDGQEEASRTYQLQYGEKVTDCASVGAWTAVDIGSAFDMSDTAQYVHGAATSEGLTVGGGLSFSAGKAQDTDDTSASIGPLGGETYTELEYSITPTVNAAAATAYCFRLYDTNNSETLDQYTQYPEATIGSADVAQLHYRWRADGSNGLNATAGWMENEDTAVTDAVQNTTYRVRIAVANTGEARSPVSQTYKLQFGALSTTCADIGAWIDVGVDAAFAMSDSGNFTHGDGTTALFTNSESYTFTAGQGLDISHTSGSGAVGALAARSVTELEYSITPTVNSDGGSTYCFRLVDTEESEEAILDTYSVYPRLTIGAPRTAVLHFRWREDTVGLNADEDWLAAEDSNSIGSILPGTTMRLRFVVANTGLAIESAARMYGIQVATGSSCSSISLWDHLSDSYWETVNSSYFAHLDPTTTLLSAPEYYTFTAGEGMDLSDSSGLIGPMEYNHYTEVEYSFTARMEANGSYCMRLYDRRADTALDTYDVYPQVTIVSCGNGVLDLGEECDDGDFDDGDGCSSSCTVEHGYICVDEPSVCTATCGDGLIANIEECDDGNTESNDGCSNVCTIETGWSCAEEPSVCTPGCGDGLVRGSEECDDSNTQSGDGCDSSCAIETGWSCAGEPSTCAPVCGDGLIRPDVLFGYNGIIEECDDGNTDDGDGCDSVCAIEAGWSCTGEPSSCTSICGDGLIRGDEECDDGNLTDEDGCSDMCTVEEGYMCNDAEPTGCWTVCGDGIVAGLEECEPPGVAGCMENCLVRTEGGGGSDGQKPIYYRPPPDMSPGLCGNGILDPGEECDFGENLNGIYPCSRDCRALYCGDGIVTHTLGEECEPPKVLNRFGTVVFAEQPQCTETPGETYCSLPSAPEGGCLLMSLPLCGEESAGETIPVAEEAYCGNGRREGDEECDYGGICYGGRYHGALWRDRAAAMLCRRHGGISVARSGDGCSDECLLEFCGDGTLQPGEECDNGRVCAHNPQQSCRTSADCDADDYCVYDYAKNPACTRSCELCHGLYRSTVDIRSFGEGKHTIKVLVRNACGFTRVEEADFHISFSLRPGRQMTYGYTNDYISAVPPNAVVGQAAPTVLVKTDRDHYILGFDTHVEVAVIVLDEYGHPVADLPPAAFDVAIDGTLVQWVIFRESTPETCQSVSREQRGQAAQCASPSEWLRCGNGILDPKEECDDGNTIDGDGCSSMCLLETFSETPVHIP